MNEEESVHLRNYLAAQSMKRSPTQIIEALHEAYRQFTAAMLTLPGANCYAEDVWSAVEILEHVYLFMSHYKTAICLVLEKSERPPDVQDRQEIIPSGDTANTQDELLLLLEGILENLAFAVLQADPLASLNVTWKHFELGEMHWREWLLFARVHLLDHVRQVEQIQTLA